MKKFLSLALALVMVLSLVTISAGATEYKDFTDKSEIKYEEAVAVLNKLGIITGYEEGDFRPEGELTRGAAAKIIVSLLIGPEAAQNLPTTGNPYPDVPAGNVFAGVISYCKNEKIINGYNDGTFRPSGTLTGYAFAKMLLGALGYDSDIEGFTGGGWTMRVAALGGSAGLYDRISFKGGETVNRETACQLALNTLKATLVEYTGGSNITVTGPENTNVTVSTDKTCKYITSNQEFAKNIKGREDYMINGGNGVSGDRNWADWYTVEFGEEHFVDLKLEHSKYNPTEDNFGRPSVEWSYKRVTIGTYPLEADYTYTTQVAHNVPETTTAAKVRALGLGDYEVTQNTEFYLNGRSDANADLANALTNSNGQLDVARIADWTDNGALVEVYISYSNADEISHVVVSQSQLMEVKRVGSDAVSLQMWDNNSKPDQNVNRDDGSKLNDGQSGYNQDAIYAKIEDVETGDDYFTMLSGMKAGDLVVVVPVAKNAIQNASDEYEVGEAYVPESVSGAFTNVTTHGATGSDKERRAIAVTVGGSKYNISQWHNEDLGDANSDTLKITRGNVTLHLDKYGNAILGENFGDASGWMIVGAFRQTLTDGRLTTLVTGWDESGNKLELNLGPNNIANGNRYVTSNGTIVPGDLVTYTSTTNSSITDWAISKGGDGITGKGVYNVWTGVGEIASENYSLKASNPNIRLSNYAGKKVDLADGTSYGIAKLDGTVKFVFVNFDDDGEVSSVSVQKQTNVSNDELRKYNAAFESGGAPVGSRAQAGVDKENTKVVVIKNDFTDVNSLYLGYVSKYLGNHTLTSSITSTQNDALTASNLKNDSRVVHQYTVVLRNTTDGRDGQEITINSYDRLNPGDFFYWTKRDVEGIENFFDLRRPNELTGRNTTVMWATLNSLYGNDKNVLRVQDYTYSAASGSPVKMYPGVATQRMGKLDAGEYANTINVSDAVWHDLTNNRINNANDLKSYLETHKDRTVSLRLVVNDNPDSDGFRDVYMIVIAGTPLRADVGVGTYENPAEIPVYQYNTQKNPDNTANKPPVEGEIDPAAEITVKFNGGEPTSVSVNGTALTAPYTVKAGDTLTVVLPGTLKVKDAAATDKYTATAVTDKEDTYTVTLKPAETDKEITIELVEKGTAPEPSSNVTVRLANEKLGTIALKDTIAVPTKVTTNFNLTAPDFVYIDPASGLVAGDVTGFKYTAYVDGKLVKAPTAVTVVAADGKISGNGTAGTGDMSVLNTDAGVAAFTDDTKIEFVITELTWANVVVKFVDSEGNKLETSDTPTAKLTTAASGGQLEATLNENIYSGKGTWEITGAKGVNGGTDVSDLSITAPTTMLGSKFTFGTGTDRKFAALGDQEVVVKVTIGANENQKFKLTGTINNVPVNGVAGDLDDIMNDADMTGTIQFDLMVNGAVKNDTIDKDTQATPRITMGAAATVDHYLVTATVKCGDQEVSVTERKIAPGGTYMMNSIDVTGNVEVTSLTVVQVNKAALDTEKEIGWDKNQDQVTIYFDTEVVLPGDSTFTYVADGSANDGETARPVKLTDDEKGIVLNLSVAPEDTAYIVVANEKKVFTKDGAEVDIDPISSKANDKAIFYNEDTESWGLEPVAMKLDITAPGTSDITTLGSVADTSAIVVQDLNGNAITKIRPGQSFQLVITLNAKTSLSGGGTAKPFTVKGTDEKVIVTDISTTSAATAVKTATWTKNSDANPTWSSGNPADANDTFAQGDVITITLKVADNATTVALNGANKLVLTAGDYS